MSALPCGSRMTSAARHLPKITANFDFIAWTPVSRYVRATHDSFAGDMKNGTGDTLLFTVSVAGGAVSLSYTHAKTG